MKKWIIILIVVAGGGYYGFTQWRAWQAQQNTDDAPSIPTTAIAIQTNINFSVNAAGEISPAQQVSVRPQINGKIEDMPVDIGDKVKKGDLLFQLNDKELKQQLASSETEVAGAQLSVVQAKRDYVRAKDMLQEKLISQQTYDDTKTTYQLATNSLARAERNMDVIKEQLTYTTVTAPFDCTVLTRPVSVGQAVSGSGGYNNGTEVMTIADLHNLIIDAHVNQADVPQLHMGQKVDVTVEAVPGLTVTGVVERIAPQATIVNNIKGFDCRISLHRPDPRVRPGMTANIRIPVASASNVVAVPLAAVFTDVDPDTGATTRYVYVVQKDGTYVKRPVRVGVADYFYAQVENGLTPGEEVSLVQPPNDLIRQAKQMASGGAAGKNSKRQATGTAIAEASVGSATPTSSTTKNLSKTAADPRPGTKSKPMHTASSR